MGCSSSSTNSDVKDINIDATLEHVQGTTFKMTVTNKGESVASVCTYYSPLEGRIMNRRVINVVDVETDEELPYTGMMAKRLAPSADNYVDVDAGESVTVEFDVESAVRMEAGKQYRLELGRAHTVLPGKAKSWFGEVEGQEVHFDASVTFTA